MKFTSVIAFLLGSAEATIEVKINDNAIERVANQADGFGERL